MRIWLRPARIEDADAVAQLLGELGYPTQAADARLRLERLLEKPDAGALVAELGGELVGLATFLVFDLVYRPRPECRLTALVVGARHRRRGVGSALVSAVEAIARGRGCFRLELNTQPGRSDASAFYAARGFAERPRRLVKMLD